MSVPSAIGFIVGSNLAPRIVRTVRPAYLMAASLAIAAAGLGVLTQVGGSDGLAIVVLASIVISLGLAPVFGLTTELIVGLRAAGARRCGLGHLRDRCRAGRRARDLDPGQHRGRDLPRRHRPGPAERHPGRGGRGGS